MFCGHCGRQLSDDMSFCGYCGKPLAPAAAQSPAPLDRAQRKAAQEAIFTRQWKAFAASRLVLITLLLYSASWVFSLFSNITQIPVLIDQMSFYLNEVTTVILAVLMVASSVLGGLLLLGMWRVYGNAVSKPNDRPASDGLRMIRTAMIATLAVGVATVLLMLMSMLSKVDMPRGAGPVLAATFLLAGVLIALIYWAILRILGKSISNVDYCQTDYGTLAGFGVVIIVLGGISALSLMVEFSLGAVLEVVAMIMCGCVMLSCRDTLKQIAWQYYCLDAPNRFGYDPYRRY